MKALSPLAPWRRTALFLAGAVLAIGAQAAIPIAG